MPPNTIYVGRPSVWGNPFKVGGYVRMVGGYLPALIKDAAMAKALYDAQFYDCPATWNAIAKIQTELRGKNLACWCPLDQPCHADILLTIANSDWTPSRAP